MSDGLSDADIELAYRKHAHSVLRRAWRLLGDEQDAREVLQEVFVSMLESPSQFGGQSSLLTWLYAATTHRCLNRLRDRSNQARLLGEHGPLLASPGRPCPPDQEIELRRLLLRLPEELSAVAVYHYLDALTYDELAEVLGCSRRTVAYLLARLRHHVASEPRQHEPA